MSRVRVLVGTRKGAFVVTADGTRRDWQVAGVWERLHRRLLDLLGEHGRIDWTRAALDSAAVPAKRG